MWVSRKKGDHLSIKTKVSIFLECEEEVPNDLEYVLRELRCHSLEAVGQARRKLRTEQNNFKQLELNSTGGTY